VGQKVLLCADSHGRDLSWHLKDRLPTYETLGYVRPGGRSRQILDRYNIESADLGKDDFLVIMCGANDVAKNEAE